MSVSRQTRIMILSALMLLVLALGGCSNSIADLPSLVPDDVPARSKEVGAYLPVHDLPPNREEAAMLPAEQARIEAELIAARDRQAQVGSKNPAAK